MSLRIAMWSGPRNISTAMMRAWENRPDTVVWDEPFYGHYLQHTGLPHPGADEVIAAQDSKWETVAAKCTGAIPHGADIFFQKHMTHHMLEHISRDWMKELVNCFLIRQPDEVLASYLRSREEATADDLGFARQAELVETARALQGEVLIVESSDLLKDPRGAFGALCEYLKIPFTEAMLAWPPGKRDSDGVWGKYWYDAVWASTGFQPYRPRNIETPAHLQPIIDECQGHYEMLYAKRFQF